MNDAAITNFVPARAGQRQKTVFMAGRKEKEKMAKVYEFDDKHYCEEDISEIDELYAGDLDDLWEAMKDSGYFYESTFYCCDEYSYESKRDCIDDQCDVVEQVEDLQEEEEGNNNGEP